MKSYIYPPPEWVYVFTLHGLNEIPPDMSQTATVAFSLTDNHNTTTHIRPDISPNLANYNYYSKTHSLSPGH